MRARWRGFSHFKAEIWEVWKWRSLPPTSVDAGWKKPAFCRICPFHWFVPHARVITRATVMHKVREKVFQPSAGILGLAWDGVAVMENWLSGVWLPGPKSWVPGLLTAVLDLRVGARVLSRFSRVRLCDPMGCSPPDSSVHGILQAGTLEWVAVASAGDLPDPGTEPRVFLHWQVGSLPLAPPGKPV